MSIIKIDIGENKFGEELRRIRKERGLTLKQLEEKLSISFTYIQKIEKGLREPEPLVKKTLEKWMKGHDQPQLVRVPLLGTVPAGFPLYIAEDVVEWVARHDLPAEAYALRVKGDSMPPLIEGDYVAFVQNGDYRNGDRVVAHNEWGEFMIKRLRVRPDGGQVLTSDNPNYPDVEPNEHYRIIGKVIKAWRDII